MKKLKQNHGKLNDKFTEPTTLDQIWGYTGTSVYGTMDDNEYTQQLKLMNKTDLQRHATKVGVFPIENRARLEDALLKKFQKHVLSFQKPRVEVKKGKKLSEKALRILAEGR